jgi:hypothetical protein
MPGQGRGFGPHCGLPYCLMKIIPSPSFAAAHSSSLQAVLGIRVLLPVEQSVPVWDDQWLCVPRLMAL